MMKKRTFAGAAIILTGIIIAAYPHLKAAYFEYSKNKLLNLWEQTITSEEIPSDDKNPEASDAFLGTAGDNPPYEQLEGDVWQEDTNVPFNASYVLKNMEGVIVIDKINLRYPILRDVTEYNLNFAICAVTGSPEMGAVGNYCLAGHKSRIYGRQFNRLQELKKGDSVNLSNGINDFIYTVTETMQVNPDDTRVLKDVPDKMLLTLITCDYTVNPIGRFIVICELTD